MSFFFETILIPFWFIVFVFASAMPLWIKWYKKFHKKFVATGILGKKIQQAKSAAEMKVDILKKATDHWNKNSGQAESSESKAKKRKVVKKNPDSVKKHNIQIVLKLLADGGEKGVLPKSISDKTNINIIETTNALTYLIEKKYAEVINSTSGTKYYLTELGRKYCINKKYILV